jgi:carbon monoxide dehydrogenase subunit G
MKLEQSFEVAAPLAQVWEALIDVERVAPCLPGASVTGRNDDGSYTGEFKVKIGPTSAAYSGKLNMESVDAEAHRATMQASGTDRRGQGGAKATIVSSVAEAGEGQTRVEVSTDYHITGRLARFGRGGMIEEISGRLLGDFATNLQGMLAGGSEGSGEAPAAAAEEAPAAAAEEAPAAAEEEAPAAEEAPPAEAPPTEAVAEEALAGEDAAATASEEAPAEDPDAAIEGATPVASAAAREPSEPAPGAEPAAAAMPPAAEPGAAAATPPPPPPPPPPSSSASESEPISAVSLVGSVALKRAKENPVPLAALVIGFLAALRLLRRRS